MLDASLQRELVELISKSFNYEQIEELGNLVLGSFDVHKTLNVERHITVSPRRAAAGLVESIDKKKHAWELIRLVVESDGQFFMGRQITIDELEVFLDSLARSGWVYDFARRRLVEAKDDPVELPNWGALRDGKNYHTTVASIDLVQSSDLARRYGDRKMKKTLYQFREFMKQKLRYYDGRIWSWGGDGGIVSFAFKNCEIRAVQCALDLQRTVRVFAGSPDYPLDEAIGLRIGIDCGTVTFQHDTGSIISDTINFAAHIEKKSTPAGHVGISDAMLTRLPDCIADVFTTEETLERRSVFITANRIDEL
ncbi:MAG: adenylate/guanylate cyclase domain-containing protein [Spirochaetales bacterium]